MKKLIVVLCLSLTSCADIHAPFHIGDSGRMAVRVYSYSQSHPDKASFDVAMDTVSASPFRACVVFSSTTGTAQSCAEE